MANTESELSILIEGSLQQEGLQKLNQTVEYKRNGTDDENDLAKRNGSPILQTSSLQDHSRGIESSYEDYNNSTSASCDNIYDFFGNTSTSASSSKCSASNSNQSFVKEGSGTNFSHNVDDNEESDNLKLVNYFTFLDDYIRFDVSRTGASCFSGYSVSVQYEDSFLEGDSGTVFCSFVCGANSRILLYYREEKVLELEYFPRASCTRPKDCIYKVKIPDQKSNEIGTIHFQGDFVRVYNSYEKCLSFRRKQGSNSYVIKAETGEKQATVELFRGFRGDIIYYGLSILGDVSSTDKALLIALTLTMDIRQRESEMRCSLIWVPLFCVLVIGLFSVLPWILYNES